MEFPYGSSSGMSSFRHARSCKNCSDPSLNQPDSDSSGQTPFRAVSGHSGVDGVCQQLRLSHSGFLSIFFTEFNNRPFSRIPPGLHGKGSRTGSGRVQNGLKSAQYGPYQALRGCPALDPGYLDLSNTCPGSPWAGSRYRVRTAEDTVTEEQLRCSGTLLPGQYWAH